MNETTPAPTVHTPLSELEGLCINTIRALAIDGIENAHSGHPGMPMGAATMAYVLWTRHLCHNPANPDWPDRDRFVLSAGHASMLLYSLLHLTGYDLTLDDIRSFRQWGSRTPGHPEHHLTRGVEVTTGPLGQGFANGVGLALAERWLAATYNRPGHEVIDHFTYVLASDGDLMEGVAYEAASLAGHLQLGRLIVAYDSNRISLSGSTDLTFTEDVGARFAAAGWHIQHVDGHDVAAVDQAFHAARAETGRPSLIVAHTHIGFGPPHRQDTFHAHGEPLGAEELRLSKHALGWPEEPAFLLPEAALTVFRRALTEGAIHQAAWEQRMAAWRKAHPAVAADYERALAGELPNGWETRLPLFTPEGGELATREAGGTIIQALATAIPNLIGGSADLDPSTKTNLKGMGDFQSPLAPRVNAPDGVPVTQGLSGGPWGYAGRNIHFGIREHAMGSICNGMARHGAIIPFDATFFTFSDYMRPAIRLAALSEVHVIHIFTHDSVAVGEDGPTHQPVEHLASLRAMPGLLVLRPADATETVEAWRVALTHRDGPVALVLTRQKLPVLDRRVLAPATDTARGAYILADAEGGPADVLLLATGSEVHVALEARQILQAEGIRSRVVSMPCWELFEAQPAAYRDAVLPPAVAARVSLEAGVSFGWDRYVGPHGVVLGIDRFGASAPAPALMKAFGMTAERVVAAARTVLGR